MAVLGGPWDHILKEHHILILHGSTTSAFSSSVLDARLVQVEVIQVSTGVWVRLHNGVIDRLQWQTLFLQEVAVLSHTFQLLNCFNSSP